MSKEFPSIIRNYEFLPSRLGIAQALQKWLKVCFFELCRQLFSSAKGTRPVFGACRSWGVVEKQQECWDI
jgi:hypothetical protein